MNVKTYMKLFKINRCEVGAIPVSALIKRYNNIKQKMAEKNRSESPPPKMSKPRKVQNRIRVKPRKSSREKRVINYTNKESLKQLYSLNISIPTPTTKCDNPYMNEFDTESTMTNRSQLRHRLLKQLDQ